VTWFSPGYFPFGTFGWQFIFWFDHRKLLVDFETANLTDSYGSSDCKVGYISISLISLFVKLFHSIFEIERALVSYIASYNSFDTTLGNCLKQKILYRISLPCVIIFMKQLGY